MLLWTVKCRLCLNLCVQRNYYMGAGGTHLGDCFINTCCEWLGRKSDDICGLDSHRISAGEKARLLVDYSVLKEAFERVGL